MNQWFIHHDPDHRWSVVREQHGPVGYYLELHSTHQTRAQARFALGELRGEKREASNDNLNKGEPA